MGQNILQLSIYSLTAKGQRFITTSGMAKGQILECVMLTGTLSPDEQDILTPIGPSLDVRMYKSKSDLICLCTIAEGPIGLGLGSKCLVDGVTVYHMLQMFKTLPSLATCSYALLVKEFSISSTSQLRTYVRMYVPLKKQAIIGSCISSLYLKVSHTDTGYRVCG